MDFQTASKISRSKGLKWNQAQVLFSIGNGSSSWADIVNDTCLDNSVVSHTLRYLIDCGDVTITKSNRPRKYVLSAQGQRLFDRIFGGSSAFRQVDVV